MLQKINQGAILESVKERVCVRKAPVEATFELSQELDLHPLRVCLPALLVFIETRMDRHIDYHSYK